MNKFDVLKKYFGYDKFREGQEPLIDGILSGRDVMGVLPTGGGKSLCYQLPALMFEGMTIVVSPLIALMSEQCGIMREKGINAVCLNSVMSAEELFSAEKQVRNGSAKLLYLSPEKLESGYILSLVGNAAVPLVAVDEAHCISQWGHDFRPSYLRISDFISALPKRPVTAAFTATAAERVREDIFRHLELRDPVTVINSFDRKNLTLEVLKCPNDAEKLEEAISFIKRMGGGSDETSACGIIYCSSRDKTEFVCSQLNMNGFPCVMYHAGMDDDERMKSQESFLSGKVRLIAATNAFGMGINKPDVRFVLHYNMPSSVENYYQEAGRAGRDGESAVCRLLYSPSDSAIIRFFIEESEKEAEELSFEEAIFVRTVKLKQLSAMENYVRSGRCLKRQILRYFGEISPKSCGKCSVCTSDTEVRDCTVECRKILSCVRRMGENFGISDTAAVLLGINGRFAAEHGFDSLPTFGIMSESSEKEIRMICEKLISSGYLAYHEDGKRLKFTKRTGDVLFARKRIQAEFPKHHGKTETPIGRIARLISEGDEAAPDHILFERLRSVRDRICRVKSLPPYAVMPDTALIAMSAVKPSDRDEMMKIDGISPELFSRCGDALLKEISEYKKS